MLGWQVPVVVLRWRRPCDSWAVEALVVVRWWVPQLVRVPNVLQQITALASTPVRWAGRVGLAADHQARPLRILAKDDNERAG